MGIYLFNRKMLVDILQKTTYEDFGKEIFPAAIRSRHVQVHLFDGYWEDIGTTRAFYEANLQLARHDPPFTLALPEAPIYSRGRFLPPSQFEGGNVEQSLIADGCRIGKGAEIVNSVIGLRCMIGDNVTIRNSVVMGADFYETSDELDHLSSELPPLGIGDGTIIENAIVDKNCRIGRNVKVCGGSEVEDREIGETCVIRDGIPVLVKNCVLPDGWTNG